jgi:GNT-I family
MSNSLAPIVLFAYKRLDVLRETINALQKNVLASESEIFIFSDAAKNDKNWSAVQEVRHYLTTVTGFKQVTVIQKDTNQGLACSIISGISHVFNIYNKAIIIEDDLETSINFLLYMNQALNFYEQNKKIISIGGFSTAIDIESNYDVYFTHRSTSWGWATWKDRWAVVDWKVSDYEDFIRSKNKKHEFNKMGSDMVRMLRRQMNGQIDSWLVRWCYHQFKHQLFSIHPFHSKVKNIGLKSKDATHTKEKFTRFNTTISDTEKIDFIFPKDAVMDTKIIKEFLRPHSIFQRAKFKVLNLFFDF